MPGGGDDADAGPAPPAVAAGHGGDHMYMATPEQALTSLLDETIVGEGWEGDDDAFVQRAREVIGYCILCCAKDHLIKDNKTWQNVEDVLLPASWAGTQYRVTLIAGTNQRIKVEAFHDPQHGGFCHTSFFQGTIGLPDQRNVEEKTAEFFRRVVSIFSADTIGYGVVARIQRAANGQCRIRVQQWHPHGGDGGWDMDAAFADLSGGGGAIKRRPRDGKIGGSLL